MMHLPQPSTTKAYLTGGPVKGWEAAPRGYFLFSTQM